MFILNASNCPLSGEYEGAYLLDVAPTLLDLAGYEIPESMVSHNRASQFDFARDCFGHSTGSPSQRG
jgi:hypothetical protein